MLSPDIFTKLDYVLGSIFGYVLISFSFYLFRRTAASRRALPLPPGPKPLPIVGNLFDVPVTGEHKVYAGWGKKYGDVVHVVAAGKHIVVLNSIKAAKDLLDGRSAIYSDRPYIPMVHDPWLMDLNWTFVFSRYSPEWRRQRRLFTRHLGPNAPQGATYEVQKESAHMLLRSLLRSPNDLSAHLKHASAEIILRIAYGYKIHSTNDPILTLVEYVVKNVGEGVLPSRFLVNVLPWLRYVPAWFPGSGFKEHAAKSREAQKKHLKVPFEYAAQKVDQGIAPPSFVTSALTHISQDDLLTDIQAVAGTMYGAGAETTYSTMHACILALVLNPSVQERAQKELDGVLGSVTSPAFRLPTFEDRPGLPYIDAIMKETLRWFPVVPIGLPHATTEEDVYRGWRIPKGSIVIANSWSILQDEKTYTDSLEFCPERFLGENPAPHPGSHGCFGFGRRECPGRHLAEASLWIQIASVLSVYTLSPTKDKDGRDIDVSYAQHPLSSLVQCPQNFPCTVTPRSSEALMRIRETCSDGD